MKISTRVLSLLSGVTCLAGLAALPGSAQSVDVDGTAFALGLGEFVPAVTLTGGSGTFFFSSSVCGVISAAINADADTDDAEAGLCEIKVLGSYSDIACNTGTVDGTATIQATTAVGTDGNGTENENVTYHIMSVAGVGVLTGTVDGDTAAGVMLMMPTGGNCLSGITQFEAAGAVASAAAGA